MLNRIITCFFLAFSAAAAAFDILPAETFYNPIPAQSSAWTSINYTNTLLEIATQPPSGKPKSTKVPASKGGATATINKLTSIYAAALRPQVKRNFNELVIGYALVEQRYGIPKNDLAGALTVYIAGNYTAYRGAQVADADVKALYFQTKQVLRASRGYTKLKPAKKRTLYEQLAILGAFPAATSLLLQQQPNPDTFFALQDASRRNLEALLNVSADRLLVTPAGLVIQ